VSPTASPEQTTRSGRSIRRRNRAFAAAAAATLVLTTGAWAVPQGAAAGAGTAGATRNTTTSAPPTLDSLARDVTRLESLREVKDVQRQYTHLAQFGRWKEMAELFAKNGTLQWGEQTATGRKAIEAWLRQDAGGFDGRSPGSLHTVIIDQPVANLSVDGRTAKVRWDGMRFLGDGKGRARIEGGLYENEYVLEGGAWKISKLVYHPQYEGEYADGWKNVDGRDLPIIPPHFTLDETGIPVPPATGPAPRTKATAKELANRIARLNDEDDARNVQNAYGYYVDRRMWTDVVDLFASNAEFRIDGLGTFKGRSGVRQALERSMGPEGLTHGVLNEYPIWDLIVEVKPNGREAIARGIQIGLLGEADEKKGAWEFAVFRNHLVKEDGLWKLSRVHITPLIRADYAQGWGDGGSGPRVRRDAPPFLKPDWRTKAAGPGGPGGNHDLADLKRRLDRSVAWDGAENVGSAYGFIIDDFQWPWMAGLFAENGHKQSPFAGYYFGRERILGAVNATYNGPLPPDALRASISFHWLTQPVIMVSHDGRSANMRTRLWQPRTSRTGSPGFDGLHGGMYHNQAVLEDGIWRLWSVTIDEHYWETPNWKAGWAGAEDPDPNAPPPPESPLLTRYPPDIKLTELGEREEGFRGGTGQWIKWPGILPMWFHYRNPVSGRTPDRFWPDCVPCVARPDASMTSHGYQMPPVGPNIDGRDLQQ
jgi:hypothetical protein